jgi:hypothetical protein
MGAVRGAALSLVVTTSMRALEDYIIMQRRPHLRMCPASGCEPLYAGP